MQQKNIRCFFAPEDLKIGDELIDVISKSIKIYDKLLLILSKQSIESGWVEREVKTALAKELKGDKCLFPIRIDDSVMKADKEWAEIIRNNKHIGDFTKWKNHDEYKIAFDRLLRDLKLTENSDK